MEAPLRYAFHPSPIGPLLLIGEPDGQGGVTLVGLEMEGAAHARSVQPGWVEDAAPFAEAMRRLDAYFAGKRPAFDLPLALRGTPFQVRVWEALRTIRYGTTIAYADLARQIGRPGAARAVGAAVGRNPIAVIVPCHRVVGADGSLTGFAGGLARKRVLLATEGIAAG